MFEQVVGEAASAVCKFDVRAPEDLVIGCDMEDGFCVGLDFGRAGEEEGRGELVDMVRVFITGWVGRGGGKNVREEGGEAGVWW